MQRPDSPSAIWIGGEIKRDSYLGFRGSFSTASPTELTIRVVCPCPFLIYFDGKWIGEGPARWPKSAPEFQSFPVAAAGGRHVVALCVHYEGVDTRMMELISPFLECSVMDGVDLSWKAIQLPGYANEVRRINPQFGWIEWSDSRSQLVDWQSHGFDDASWPAANSLPSPIGEAKPSGVQLLPKEPLMLHALAKDLFTESFGYESDDPPARFFLRDLEAHHGAPQGVWRRYDLGKVRLGRAAITIDAPRGSAVEIAYSESLAGASRHDKGRVNPWITLSGGSSCNMDHFVSRGGPQTFVGHTPRGGRFVEVHVLADPKHVNFIDEQFFERTHHGPPIGSFHSADKRIDQIWLTGVETYRTCSEDCVIDNPTRERGQWIGDTLTVGLENCAVAFPDLSLFRRAIRHAAESARHDGLVAGLCPGTASYLSTYACHWVTANVRLWELTGDKAFLAEMFPAAERSMAVFAKCLTTQGLSGDLGWAFIDWGYVGNDGPSDMGLNLIYIGALKAMIRWSEALGLSSETYRSDLDKILTPVNDYLHSAGDWQKIGLQRTVLALRAGLIDEQRVKSGLDFIKRHYLSCFPNDPLAPNLADPSTAQSRLITPFFSHFALPVLWENGEGDFALEQYRSCWGWALDQGLTTWPEVFDLRWSHCHQWSGCPTWQLSRYVLGLWPRQDLGASVFDFRSARHSLKSAAGFIPVPGSDQKVKVSFIAYEKSRRWVFESPLKAAIRINGKFHEFVGRFEHSEPTS